MYVSFEKALKVEHLYCVCDTNYLCMKMWILNVHVYEVVWSMHVKSTHTCACIHTFIYIFINPSTWPGFDQRFEFSVFFLLDPST